LLGEARRAGREVMFESFVCGFFFLSLFGFSLEVEEDTLICLFFVVLVSGFVSLLMEEEAPDLVCASHGDKKKALVEREHEAICRRAVGN
jgi:hypothetical protein